MYLTAASLTLSCLALAACAVARVERWLSPGRSTNVFRGVEAAVAESMQLITIDGCAKTASETCAVAVAVGTPIAAAVCRGVTLDLKKPKRVLTMTLEDRLAALTAALEANTRAVCARAGEDYPPAADAPPPERKTRGASAAAAKALTVEDVRAVMKDLPQAMTLGLLRKYSTDGKLSNVPASKYAALIAEAKKVADVSEADEVDPLEV